MADDAPDPRTEQPETDRVNLNAVNSPSFSDSFSSHSGQSAGHDANRPLGDRLSQDPNQESSFSEAEILAELLKLVQEPVSPPNRSGEAEPIPAKTPAKTSQSDRFAVSQKGNQSEISSLEASVHLGASAQAIPTAQEKDLAESVDSSLLELQRLLFSFDQSHLDRLRARIENPEQRAVDLSEVLRQAIELHTLEREQIKLLAAAMLPTIEQAIQDSVEKDEEVMSTAIFPIVGPAARKAIAAALENTIQGLDQLLEHSLSPQAWLWRLEAMRTRRSFAEVVLMRTLQFRVEQIFLIHRATGLLLQEVKAPLIQAQDPNLVAAMLGAIDNFVQDSFSVKSGGALHTLRFGELTIWIEQGPQAILAAVLRGQAPSELRHTLQQAIERIHRDHHAALVAFQGDAAPFSATLPQLETCLETRYKTPPQKKGRPYFWALFGVVVTVLGLWGGHEYILRRRWAVYVDRLKAEPGIVVNRAERRWGGFSIAGLRDPLAADPVQLLPTNQLDPQSVTSEWQPYLSLQPQLLAARARQILQPPATVTLSVDQQGTLRAIGTAPLRWTQEAEKLAPLIPGITQFKQEARIAEIQALGASRARIEAQLLRFEEGTTTLTPGQEATIALLVQEVRKVTRLATQVDRQVQLELIGRANPTGTPARNLALSQERARRIAEILTARGIASGQIRAIGIGTRQPLTSTTLPAEQINRSVAFRLLIRDSSRLRSGSS